MPKEKTVVQKDSLVEFLRKHLPSYLTLDYADYVEDSGFYAIRERKWWIWRLCTGPGRDLAGVRPIQNKIEVYDEYHLVEIRELCGAFEKYRSDGTVVTVVRRIYNPS